MKYNNCQSKDSKRFRHLSIKQSLSKLHLAQVVLLGQNVNSYNDLSATDEPPIGQFNTSTVHSKGFSSICKSPNGGHRFAELVYRVSLIDPEMRIRFTSPHPKDFPDDVRVPLIFYP